MFGMRRREFVALLGGAAAAWPLAARAQPADRIARVGFFGADRSIPLGATLYQAFIDELQIYGFKNGQNLIVDFRRVEQDLRALSADAAALVRSNVNVLVTQGTEPALQAALSATRTLPIVMMAANYDPFVSGYVKSLARPDGNVTGVFLRQTELAEKQTELLWQAFPDRTRIGILWDAISADQFSAAEHRAKIFGLQVHPLKLENPPYDFEAAFGSLAAASTQTLLVLSSPPFFPGGGAERFPGAPMDEVTIARALHVFSVVIWIGGVAFVTTVLLPAIRRLKSPNDRMAFFDGIERRFAWQARITAALAGLSGLDMLVRLDLWHRFLSASYWWMHAMVVVWLLFTVMLFVAEPLFLHRWLLDRAKAEPEATFRLVERLHRVLLTLSLITLVGAVAGSHGFVLFE